MARALAVVTLVVRDYDEAIAFYTGPLGFGLIEDTPLDEGKRWVVVAPSESPGTALLLAKATTPEQTDRVGDQTGGRVFLFLRTTDFWGDYEKMRVAGVRFAEEPRHESYGWVVVFLDLYGNKWDLVEAHNACSVDVNLVPATRAERVALWAMMRDELAEQFERITQAMGLSWAEFEALYAARGEVLAMRCEGEVAGYCWIELRNRELHLHAIFVLPEQRGRGIGSAALRRLEATFGQQADVIELGVSHDNPRARALYERLGFVVVTTLPDVGYDIMRKPLTKAPLA